MQSTNPFRAQWLYRRLPAGDAMLAAEKGLSPAFLKLLTAVDADQPISFSSLEARFAHLDADDLELWLAELCRMQLITPAQSASEQAQVIDEGEAGTTVWPDVLLVHKLPSTRLAWRDLLSHLPVHVHGAATLEEADAAYNSLRPACVVIGPEGEDFNALNLVHALKHPRAPRLTKVILMLEEKSFSSRIKNAAARADDTVTAEAWGSLAERVAQLLSLPKLAANTPLPVASPSPTYAEAPVGLEEEHPAVASTIIEQWGKPSLDDYFDEMIFASPTEGTAFSEQAMEELMFLYRLHRDVRPRDDAWRTNMPRGRRARVAALRATSRLRTLQPNSVRQTN